MRKYYQGKFRPTNPQKYVGDIANINYRSLWELKFMKFLDMNPNVLHWASEEFHIPYLGLDGEMHRYFPDFLVKLTDKTGNVLTYLVEIKPHKQSVRSTKTMRAKNGQLRSEKVRRRLAEDRVIYETNERKWTAAETFAKKHGWIFKVITEKMVGF